MAANNSTTTVDMAALNAIVCDESPYFLQLISNAKFVTYSITYPLYLILCPPAHIVLLVTFFKQRKSEPAYMYQLINAFGTTCEMVFHILYICTSKLWAGMGPTDGAIWFRRIYPLMVYATYVANTAYNTFLCSSMLFSLSMSIDRIFALTKPFLYKNINKSHHQLAAFIISMVISFGITIPDSFRYKVIQTADESYAKVYNPDNSNSVYAKVMVHVRNTVFMVGVVLLVVSNTALLRLFRNRNAKVKVITGTSQNEKLRKKKEKTLIFLSLAQACSVTIKMTGLALLFALLYYPVFATCGVRLYDPLFTATQELVDIIELYMIFALSDRCRVMVAKAFPFLNRFRTTTGGNNLA